MFFAYKPPDAEELDKNLNFREKIYFLETYMILRHATEFGKT